VGRLTASPASGGWLSDYLYIYGWIFSINNNNSY